MIVQESILKAKLDSNVSFEHNVKIYFNEIIESKDLRELEEIASKMAKSGEFDRGRGSVGHDTVGAVALDSSGNIACATSTGSLNSYFLCQASQKKRMLVERLLLSKHQSCDILQYLIE